MLKIGAMSICLAQQLPEAERTTERILQVAAEAGLDGVEFYQTEWGGEPAHVDEAEALKRRAGDMGLEVFGLGSGERVGRRDQGREGALQVLRDQIRTAAGVGAGVVTFPAIDAPPLPAGGGREGTPFVRGLAPLVEQMVELAEFAAPLGVRLGLLNHCYFVGAAWQQEWALRLAGADNLGACIDPGNYLFYECGDPVAASRLLAGRVCAIRLGDWRRRDEAAIRGDFAESGRLSLYEGALFGTGEVDHRRCLEELQAGGYSGYLSIKSVGSAPEGPAAAFTRSLEAVRALVR
ncbi:MAG: TIM barrel protein [Candidatus Latescibacteria bacterium]|nr:TIM barrel protein [Candidatus Latescibacterota bacterium]